MSVKHRSRLQHHPFVGRPRIVGVMPAHRRPTPILAMVLCIAGLRRQVCLACVPEAQVGEYVIVHAGVAISRLDAEEAERLLDVLREMSELEDGHEVP